MNSITDEELELLYVAWQATTPGEWRNDIRYETAPLFNMLNSNSECAWCGDYGKPVEIIERYEQVTWNTACRWHYLHLVPDTHDTRHIFSTTTPAWCAGNTTAKTVASSRKKTQNLQCWHMSWCRD